MNKADSASASIRKIRLLKWGGAGLLLFIVLAIACVLWAMQLSVPSYEQVRGDYRTSYVTLLDRNGSVLERVRRDFHDRRDNWTSIEEVSPALVRAVLLSEDRRFYQHPGVDLLALGGALRDRLTRHSIRGSSTLTMQLAGMFIPESGKSGRRTVMQKLRQMALAIAFEQHWDKSQILEAYLNLVPWRGELSGITAASRSLFGKYPEGLDSRESAILATMLRSPNASAQVISRRACGLLTQQSLSQYCDYLQDFVTYQLTHGTLALPDDPFIASHYARRRLAQGSAIAGPIRTSINSKLQATVQTVINRVAHQIRNSHANDAAAVVLDNRSGEILAYVGSSGEMATAPQVDNSSALRQAGSTLKPFLYAQALEQQRITAASLLDDSAVNLPTGNGLYVPQNYDKQFGGWVSARTALASSLNIPAVRLLVMVTPDVFHQRLRTLGLPLTESGDYYGYSLALGSADVTLLSLTNAYRALANHGVYSEVNWGVESAPANVRVMSEAAAWLVGDILSDRQARARTFGLDSALSTPFWTAVKTGTSKDMRDNWTIGWSESYTVGVWVGNSTGASMREVSGVTGAGPIWHDIMSYLHRERGSRQPPRPATLTESAITFENDTEAARTEYFLAGTEMTHIALASSAGSAGYGSHLADEDMTVDLANETADATATSNRSNGRIEIRAPADGTIIALDPDIPQLNQRLQLYAVRPAGGAHTAVRWYADGQYLSDANPFAWYPVPGSHVIDARDANGQIQDQVRIHVRGAQLRQHLGHQP